MVESDVVLAVFLAQIMDAPLRLNLLNCVVDARATTVITTALDACEKRRSDLDETREDTHHENRQVQRV